MTPSARRPARPSTPGVRPVGRPRLALLDEALLLAADAIVREQGVRALTMDGLARRAGTTRSALYRRYRNRSEVIVALLQRSYDETPVLPDTGSVRGDLLENVVLLAGYISVPSEARFAAEVAAERLQSDEVRTVYAEHWQVRRRALRRIVERGVERGEVCPDIDPDVVLDAIAGAVYYRVLYTDGPLDRKSLAALVDAVLDGVRPAPP